MTDKTSASMGYILFVITGMVLVLVYMGQPFFSRSGEIMLWVGDIGSSELSQQIFDWYTFSHIIHGFIFYGLLHFFFPRMSIGKRLLIAVCIESAWEIIENTPQVIEHYRQQALAAGYVGDSVLNSVMDVVSMMFGFYVAKIWRWWIIVIIAVVFELGTLYCVRDNLTLNIINLIYPFETIHQWQSE